MHRIELTTLIAAPPERCFDLARSVDVHVRSAGQSGERAIGGRTSGLLELGEEVTWEGRHFGLVQQLTSRITECRRPHYFQDRMVRGAFQHLEHDHFFEPDGAGGTRMVDVLRFTAPFVPVGWLVERVLLGPHLAQFLRKRNDVLREIAESGDRLK